MKLRHVVNISGGKDSAAVALLAAESGRAFDLVMADTGNEHPATVEYAHHVANFVNKPLQIARADFADKLVARRAFVAANWRKHGVPEDRVLRALDILQPTGNPFLDLCLWKGRFPSRKAQFCTEWLKQKAVEDCVVGPILETAPVAQWLGVRRDESLNRRSAPMFQRIARKDKPHGILLYRPIIHWSAADVFSFAATKGLPPNPLYKMGFGRVGCFPCINASKAELRQIGTIAPDQIARLVEWERLVAEASKRGAATFFASDVTPEGAYLGRTSHGATPEESAKLPWPRAAQVFDWAKTSRGGRQYNLFHATDDGLSCSSQYGLCE